MIGSVLDSPARLEALRATGLLDSPAEPEFDGLTRLARRMLDAPVALISLVVPDRQFLKSVQGLCEPWASLRQTPLSHSYCKHVVTGSAPLLVSDARLHPWLCDSPAIQDLGAIAYLGVPVSAPDGQILGACAVIDAVERAWSKEDLDTVTELGRAVTAAIAARVHRRRSERIEAALRASEARQFEILESIDEAFYALDRDWRFTYVNQRAEKFWGISRQDLIGRAALSVFPSFAGSASHRAHQQAMLAGAPARLETLSSILQLPVDIRIFPGPSGLSVYFRDVSDRHRMEQTLRDRDATLALAEQSAGIGVWDVELGSNMARGTPQFFRIMGLPPTSDPVPIETFQALRHPEDRERVVEGFRRAVASGGDLYESEYRILRPDGRLRWIFGRGRVVRDATGKPVRYSGVDIDITERKLAEAALAESEERLRQSVRVARLGIFEHDHRSGAMHWSAEMRAICGLGPEQRVSLQAFIDSVHPEDRDAVKAALQLAEDPAGEGLCDVEHRILRADGVVRWVSARSRTFFEIQGRLRRPVRTVGAMLDITERKEADERILLLMREVNHRAKNLLAVVQAVAHQTAHGSHPADFARRFSDRLRALSASQDLLVQEDWRGVRFIDLLQSQLAHFDGLLESRLRMSGPDINLAPAAAQAIGMALHELGTNAVKHGAWSNDSGLVEVTWQMAAEGDAAEFTILWVESGGPPVAEPGASGFGRTVTERMVAHALDGKVSLRFAPSGLVWELKAPAERTVQLRS